LEVTSAEGTVPLRRVEWLFGGDRNFTASAEERLSSNGPGNWYPGAATLQAWEGFESSMGFGMIVPQEDFTWERLCKTRDGCTYCKQVLDVAGVSVDLLSSVNFVPSSICETRMPFPAASDHKPVAVEYRLAKPPRKTNDKGAKRVFRVPEWLLEDSAFSEQLGIRIEEWSRSRGPGFEGIEVFNNMVSALAQRYLKTEHVKARTPEHRFQVACSLLSALQVAHGQVRTDKLNKMLRIYPALGAMLKLPAEFKHSTQQFNRVMGSFG